MAGVVLVAAASRAQGRGHGMEANAPIPSAGPGDMVKRILAEQFVTFPRFGLSGGWVRRVSCGDEQAWKHPAVRKPSAG